MKKLIITSFLLAIFATCNTIVAQNVQEEYLGLPGDNLNLYAVMRLFQESKTLEDFERSLNDENSNINNLDLNGDNLVDYIRVIDYVDGNVHNIVLQDAVDNTQTQDVAVFTVQRSNNGQVQIQLTGDEALYGKDYIIEPRYADGTAGETPNPGYTGGTNVTVVTTSPVIIARWPIIRFMYRPSYVAWHSRWYWGYYPSYWHPWQPFSWNYYYGYQYNWYRDYYRDYRRLNYHRYPRWNEFYYTSRRSHSSYVSNRIQSGSYKSTYSHPEQRREGEAMYTRLHSSQNNKQTGRRTSGTTSAGSSRTQTNRNINSTGNRVNTQRRSTSTVNERSGTVRQPVQNSNSSRRSTTTTTTTRPITNKSAGQNTTTTGRSTTTRTKTNRSVATQRSGQNAETTRRSSSVGNRSTTNPPRSESAGRARSSSSKSSATRVNSSSRRSSGSSKAVKTEKKSGNSKTTATKKESRRK